MKATTWTAIFLLATTGCTAPRGHGAHGGRQPTSDPTAVIDEMNGQNLDQLMRACGLPDSIDPATDYSAKFTDGTPSVVLTYNELERRVYVKSDCVILGVVPVKER